MCGAKKASAPAPVVPEPQAKLEPVRGGAGNRSNRGAVASTLLSESNGNLGGGGPTSGPGATTTPVLGG